MAKLAWNGTFIMDQINSGAAEGLAKAAEHLLTEATKTVPIEEGILSGDGQVSVDVGLLEATVYYDGASNPYAVRQHEELSFRHDPGRRAKWLELAAQEEESTMRQIIADEIRKAHQP